MKVVCVHGASLSAFARFSLNIIEDEGIFAKLRSQPSTQAQSRRHAKNVHACVSTNERTPFQSRTLVLDCWSRNGASAHEGLTFLKEPRLGDSGPSRERVRDFCEYLAQEHTDQETRIRPQCARFAIRARS